MSYSVNLRNEVNSVRNSHKYKDPKYYRLPIVLNCTAYDTLQATADK